MPLLHIFTFSSPLGVLLLCSPMRGAVLRVEHVARAPDATRTWSWNKNHQGSELLDAWAARLLAAMSFFHYVECKNMTAISANYV